MRIPDGDSLSLSWPFCCNYGLSLFFTLYLKLAVVFSPFFLFFFFASSEEKASGPNAMLMLRIVNTKPCNLPNAFVIFTSNFSGSTVRVPHMKTEESKGSRGMRPAKNEHKDG